MTEQLPPLPYAVAHILLGDDSENVFTSEQMEDYARAALAAKAVPDDPCLVLWKAMNQAGKVGNRTDDKLIVKFLREAGYCIAATPAPAPEAERQALRYAQAEAVMPLIGPLLDAWENVTFSALDDAPELAKCLSEINKAMEGAEAPPAPEAEEAVWRCAPDARYCASCDVCKAAPAPEAKPEYFGDGPLVDGWELSISKGRSGYGVYAHMTDYPDEGAVFLLGLKLPAAAPAQAQQAAEPLPCPFCGHVGLDFADGSTHRWGLASCAGCGATCGETRRAYPPDDKWHASAIKDWNTRAKPEAQQPLGEAQLEAAYREIWRNKPAHFGFTTSDWITAGIRYAERAHGIGASGEAS